MKYTIEGSTLEQMGNKVRLVTGLEETMTPDEMSGSLEDFNVELGMITSEQSSLIEQIKTALEGKVTPSDQTKAICFSINKKYYPAEEGMTWIKWVESEYNTEGYFCDSGSVYFTEEKKIDGVLSTDEIIANTSYYWKLYLYHEGNEYESVTGGWLQSPIANNINNWDYTPADPNSGYRTFTKNADNLYLYAKPKYLSEMQTSSCYTANKIDLTGTSTLVIEYENVQKTDFIVSGHVGSTQFPIYDGAFIKYLDEGSSTVEVNIDAVNEPIHILIGLVLNGQTSGNLEGKATIKSIYAR